MTQEEIMQTWETAARRFYSPTPSEMIAMYRNNKNTALKKLISKYKWFSIFGLIMAIVSTQWFIILKNCEVADTGLALLLTIVFIVYFGVCSIMDYWLYKGVSAINCYTMSVSEVADKALYYRKRHNQFVAILIPCAFVVLGVLAYVLRADESAIIGMVCGFIVGAILGIRQYIEFMAQYKRISKE